MFVELKMCHGNKSTLKGLATIEKFFFIFHFGVEAMVRECTLYLTFMKLFQSEKINEYCSLEMEL